MNRAQEIRSIARNNALIRRCKRKHGKHWDEAMATSLPFRLHLQNHPNFIGKRPRP